MMNTEALKTSPDGNVRIVPVSPTKVAVEFRSRDRWARTPAVSGAIALQTFARFNRQCS